jgi:hypothetical protein
VFNLNLGLAAVVAVVAVGLGKDIGSRVTYVAPPGSVATGARAKFFPLQNAFFAKKIEIINVLEFIIKLIQIIKMSSNIISASDEIKYISSRYNIITKKQVAHIINTYYFLAEHTHMYNPEDHYNTIANIMNINNETIIDIFNLQLEFLNSKGLVD